jgi:ribose transport system substrate-binding protein
MTAHSSRRISKLLVLSLWCLPPLILAGCQRAPSKPTPEPVPRADVPRVEPGTSGKNAGKNAGKSAGKVAANKAGKGGKVAGGKAATATGGQGAGQTKGRNGQKLVIALIPQRLNNSASADAKLGAERTAQAVGGVAVMLSGPPQDDPAQQKTAIEAAIGQRVDGILLSCADPGTVRPAIDKAVASGVPVVTYGSDAPQSKRVAFFGVSDISLGQKLGESLAHLLHGKGRVAILSGTRTALQQSALQQREAGVRRALGKWRGLQIIGTFYGNADMAQSRQIVADVTRRQKPDGWVLLGNWPLLAKDGLSALPPGKIKVVAVDPLPETWPWIEKNYVQVCLGQKYFNAGEEGVKLLLKAMRREPIPGSIDSGLDVVTPQTLPAYRKAWAAMKRISQTR